MLNLPDPTPAGPEEIKRRSRVPGVLITQYVKTVPKGFSTPDFIRKPFTVTAAEGKNAIFRAVVSGDPTPNVTWGRNNGDCADPEKFKGRYDERNREYIFEVHGVVADHTDTYKFYATNEYGKAMCTSALKVTEVRSLNLKAGPANDPENFRTMLKKTTKIRPKKKPKIVLKDGELDPAMWEILLSSPRKEWERICFEFGVTDFRFILKKLKVMKEERDKEQAKVVEQVDKMKQIEVRTDGTAEFGLNMKLKNPNSEVLLYKDGVMLDYGTDGQGKYNLDQNGDNYKFSIKDLGLNDGGIYQVDVEDSNIMSTNFKVHDVEFSSALKDCKAKEGEDAAFECVLSAPVSKIMWYKNDVALEEGEKCDIIVSEDKKTHRLVIKDLELADQGIITAIAGTVISKAILEVEEDPNRRKGKGSGDDDEAARLAAERARLQKEKDDLEAQRRAQAERDAAARAGDGSGGDGSGLGNGSGDGSGKDGDGGLGSDSQGKGALAEDMQVSMVQGLTDTYATRGQPAELTCTLSGERDGVWYKDGEELTSGGGVTLVRDGVHHKLIIHSARDDLSGQYTFVAGDAKSSASLFVGDGPEFDPDDLHKFSKPVIVKVGQHASWKMPFLPQDGLEIKWFKDGAELHDGGGVKIHKDPALARLQIRDCIRSDEGKIKIQLKNPFGVCEATSRLIVLDKPGPPEGPVDIVDSSSNLIELHWKPPKDDGNSPVTNYIIERQQVGQPMWKKLGDNAANKLIYRDRNVAHGKNYIYRIYAQNALGISDALGTETIMAGILVFPGPPAAPKVESAFKNCINLTWEPPEEDFGEPIIGYQLEKRKKDLNQWIALNAVNDPIDALKSAVKDISEGAEYQFRVAAINMYGAGEPSPPSAMVAARNPKMKPRFLNPDNFLVIRAGNAMRIKMDFEGEPQPDITWVKDDEPVAPWVNIINVEGCSTLVIPSSKRSDSGFYTITAKNSSGSASFEIEVRVTDMPKKPGPVELEQIIHRKLIINWAPSPDEELDDRLHYTIAEKESNTRVWRTIADRLFCHTFTTNIHSGREYHFRVFAKNDIGLSDPSDSPTWGVNSLKVQASSNKMAGLVSLERPPSILVPLKVHTPPKGYKCYMTCAIRGSPTPHISWYLNDICINSNQNYYITNAHGICSMYILRVTHEDAGEYRVVANNMYGKAECSTKVCVKD